MENSKTPKKLRPYRLRGLTEFELPNEKRHYIYFLLQDEEVVYIGQTVHVSSRVWTHSKDKKFNRCFFMVVKNTESIDIIEGFYIIKLTPKYNKGLPCPPEVGNYAKLQEAIKDFKKGLLWSSRFKKEKKFKDKLMILEKENITWQQHLKDVKEEKLERVKEKHMVQLVGVLGEGEHQVKIHWIEPVHNQYSRDSICLKFTFYGGKGGNLAVDYLTNLPKLGKVSGNTKMGKLIAAVFGEDCSEEFDFMNMIGEELMVRVVMKQNNKYGEGTMFPKVVEVWGLDGVPPPKQLESAIPRAKKLRDRYGWS